jgi:tyrosyl-tRNA synthetase
MQCADIFQLDVDMIQMGLDQRRVNMLSREVGPALGWKKPVVVSHHMLLGLQGMKEPEGFETNKALDAEISSKMSKSKPQGAIFAHDSPEDIKKKIAAAFCEPKNASNNPMLDYSKHIIFRAFKAMKVERPKKFGGAVEYENYAQLEKDFAEGKLHPLDLKNAVAESLNQLIAPVRQHFEKDRHAKALYEFVKAQEITR